MTQEQSYTIEALKNMVKIDGVDLIMDVISVVDYCPSDFASEDDGDEIEDCNNGSCFDCFRRFQEINNKTLEGIDFIDIHNRYGTHIEDALNRSCVQRTIHPEIDDNGDQPICLDDCSECSRIELKKLGGLLDE